MRSAFVTKEIRFVLSFNLKQYSGRKVFSNVIPLSAKELWYVTFKNLPNTVSRYILTYN